MPRFGAQQMLCRSKTVLSRVLMQLMSGGCLINNMVVSRHVRKIFVIERTFELNTNVVRTTSFNLEVRGERHMSP